MKSVSLISAILIVLGFFVPPVQAGDSAGNGGVLWNVTETGDTLTYLNLFPMPESRKDRRLPGYFRKHAYDSVRTEVASLSWHPEISDNPLYLMEIAEEYPTAITGIEREQKNIWLPAALIAVSGVTSAYFKLEANQAYDRYLNSIDRDNIRHYYDLSRKYDTVSGISFVFLQVGFGWLTYELMR